jgi:hypothetical protein
MRPMKPRKVGGPHELLVDALAEIGIGAGDPTHGVEIAADFLGMSHWTLRKEIDPDQKGELSFVRVSQLASKFRLARVAEYFASLAGGIFLSLRMSGVETKWSELTGAAAIDMGRFTSEIVQDLSDGKIDKVEASRCLKIHSELMRHHAELHAMLRAIANGDEA